MNDIKVSIITISYNQGQFIERTIQSVLNQTYKNIEYILIDGKSTDNTMDIVNKYKEQVDVIVHEKDSGQSNAINKGFKLATGELVGWINSDDVLYPTCIERIVDLYISKKNGAIYYNSQIDVIDINDNFLWHYTAKIPNKNYLLKKCYNVIQQGSFYASHALKKVGYINESFYYCMDLDLWLRLLNYGDIYAIDNESLAAIRQGDYTKTSTGGRKFLREIRTTLLKNGGTYFSRTIFNTYKYSIKRIVDKLISR